MSLDEALAAGIPAPGDRAAAVAAAHSDGVLVVDVPADAELDVPVRLRLTGEGLAAHGHVLVRVGRFARATVVLEHAGTAEYGELLTVLAGDGSQVTARLRPGVGRRQPPPRASTTSSSAATPRSGTSSSPSAAASSG